MQKLQKYVEQHETELEYRDETSTAGTLSFTDYLYYKRNPQAYAEKFHENLAKTKFKGQLVRAYQTAFPELTDPPRFSMGKLSRYRVDTIATMLSEAGVAVMKVTIPSRELIDQEVTILGFNREEAAIEKLELNVELPNFAVKPIQVEYQPSYSVTNYDLSVLRMAYAMTVHDPAARFMKLALELKELAETTYFGAYGVQGQIKRITDVNKIFAWSKAHPSLYSPPANFENLVALRTIKKHPLIGELPQSVRNLMESSVAGEMFTEHMATRTASYKQLLDRVFPLCYNWRDFKIEYTATSVLEAYWEEKFALMNSVPPFKLFDVVMTSNAGILFPKQTHADVFASEMAIASMFLGEYSQITPTSTPSDHLLFLRRWSFMVLSQLKPKPEVYDRPTDVLVQKAATKIRNISATSISAALPAKVIFAFCYKFAPNFLTVSSSVSLLNWSPFHGGMDKLIRFVSYKNTFQMKQNPIQYLIFSDNIYIFQRLKVKTKFFIIFISLDGAKMEAVSNAFTITAETSRLMSSFGAGFRANRLRGNASTIADAYATYMTEFYPQLAANGIGVLGRSQIPTNGLSSGVVGTGYMNTSRMAHFIGAAEKNSVTSIEQLFSVTAIETGKPKLTPKPLYTTVKEECGIELTIETHISWEIDLNSKGEYQIKTLETTGDEPIIYKTDLLGYDMVRFDGYHYPALARERLLKSTLYHKFEHYQRLDPESDDFELMAVMKIVILKALYLIGGFAYPDISELLKKQIQASSSDLALDISSFNEAKARLLENIAPSDEDEDETKSSFYMALESINTADIPTIVDLKKLHFANPILMTKVGPYSREQVWDGYKRGIIQVMKKEKFSALEQAETLDDTAIDHMLDCIHRNKQPLQKEWPVYQEAFKRYIDAMCISIQEDETVYALPSAPMTLLESVQNIEQRFTVKQHTVFEDFAPQPAGANIKIPILNPELTQPRPVSEKLTRTDFEFVRKHLSIHFFDSENRVLKGNWYLFVRNFLINDPEKINDQIKQYFIHNLPLLLLENYPFTAKLPTLSRPVNRYDIMAVLRTTRFDSMEYTTLITSPKGIQFVNKFTYEYVHTTGEKAWGYKVYQPAPVTAQKPSPQKATRPEAPAVTEEVVEQPPAVKKIQPPPPVEDLARKMVESLTVSIKHPRIPFYGITDRELKLQLRTNLHALLAKEKGTEDNNNLAQALLEVTEGMQTLIEHRQREINELKELEKLKRKGSPTETKYKKLEKFKKMNNKAEKLIAETYKELLETLA